MDAYQVAVFMEERKWDYRGACHIHFSHRLINILDICSFWLCRGVARRSPYHWAGLLHLQQSWCSYVGSRLVPPNQTIRHLISLVDLEKRQHFIMAEHRRSKVAEL